MDTAWCGYCFQHIDFSDTALYCSEECKSMDGLPMEVKERMNFTPPSRSNNSKYSNTLRLPSPTPSSYKYRTASIPTFRLPASSLLSSNNRISPSAVTYENAVATSGSFSSPTGTWFPSNILTRQN